MSLVRKVWFSTRRLITYHIYPNCGAAENIQSENESTTWVEVDEDGYPMDLPETATLCGICRDTFQVNKSHDPFNDEDTFRYLV